MDIIEIKAKNIKELKEKIKAVEILGWKSYEIVTSRKGWEDENGCPIFSSFPVINLGVKYAILDDEGEPFKARQASKDACFWIEIR